MPKRGLKRLPAGARSRLARLRSTVRDRRSETERLRELYLTLLKSSLTDSLHPARDKIDIPEHMTAQFADFFRERGYIRERSREEAREEGRIWPRFAHTMVGLKRLDNLQACIEDVLANKVPGDLIETGVWRGGSAILMRGVLRAHRVSNRTVFAADSFQGLPAPDTDNYPADAEDPNHTVEALAVSLREVRDNFRRYGLLDRQVTFLEGWFRDTLPTLHDRRWAVIRLDGDMYESTMDGLTNLYPRLSPGGYLIVDDYGFPACRQAVHDYREAHGITEEIREIDWTGAYWQRRS